MNPTVKNHEVFPFIHIAIRQMMEEIRNQRVTSINEISIEHVFYLSIGQQLVHSLSNVIYNLKLSLHVVLILLDSMDHRKP